jgi:hypothetical protein
MAHSWLGRPPEHAGVTSMGLILYAAMSRSHHNDSPSGPLRETRGVISSK